MGMINSVNALEKKENVSKAHMEVKDFLIKLRRLLWLCRMVNIQNDGNQCK